MAVNKPFDPKSSVVAMQRVTFAAREYAYRYQIPEQNLVLRSWTEQDQARIVLEMVRKVATISSDGILKIETPATWWQHFKRTLYLHPRLGRFVPDRMVKRWPVRYDTRVYKAEAMFPYLPVPAYEAKFEIGFFDWTEV